MFAYLFYVCSAVWYLPTYMMSYYFYLYNVCSTELCLSSVYVYDVCLFVLCLPTCILPAVSAYLCDVCLLVSCLPASIMSSYLCCICLSERCYPPVWYLHTLSSLASRTTFDMAVRTVCCLSICIISAYLCVCLPVSCLATLLFDALPNCIMPA
jgi:hypothetical protein